MTEGPCPCFSPPFTRHGFNCHKINGKAIVYLVCILATDVCWWLVLDVVGLLVIVLSPESKASTEIICRRWFDKILYFSGELRYSPTRGMSREGLEVIIETGPESDSADDYRGCHCMKPHARPARSNVMCREMI